MAGGWAKDGAVQRTDSKRRSNDELAACKSRNQQPRRKAATHCGAECGRTKSPRPPPAKALPGVKLCIDCVVPERTTELRKHVRHPTGAASKDSQLKVQP